MVLARLQRKITTPRSAKAYGDTLFRVTNLGHGYLRTKRWPMVFYMRLRRDRIFVRAQATSWLNAFDIALRPVPGAAGK